MYLHVFCADKLCHRTVVYLAAPRHCHLFPRNPPLRQQWIVAVRRVDANNPGRLWQPSRHSVGGSTSDRQICERSDLISILLFSAGDSIIADRGFNVQNLFATKNVHVNIPSFLKGKSQLTAAEVVKDRRIASKRIHIERVIGLAKTFKILKQPLPAKRIRLGNRIIKVCFLLCNFKTSIVGSYA